METLTLAAAPVCALIGTGTNGLKDVPALHARPALAGNGAHRPRIIEGTNGRVSNVHGKHERAAHQGHTARYRSNYHGRIGQWRFPFGNEGHWPAGMALDTGRKKSLPIIEDHDQRRLDEYHWLHATAYIRQARPASTARKDPNGGPPA